MRDLNAVRSLVAAILEIDEKDLQTDTRLDGHIQEVAMRVCLETGREIILNEGDTWQTLVDQLTL